MLQLPRLFGCRTFNRRGPGRQAMVSTFLTSAMWPFTLENGILDNIATLPEAGDDAYGGHNRWYQVVQEGVILFLTLTMVWPILNSAVS